MSERKRAVISSILLKLGLTPGVDFRVKPYMGPDGITPEGNIVTLYGFNAPKMVANHADAVESEAARLGAAFHVSVRYPFLVTPDRPLVEVADFGTKVREPKPKPRKVGAVRLNETRRTTDRGLIRHALAMFPRGTRVLATDPRGIVVAATVNGRDISVTSDVDPEDASALPTEWRVSLGITFDETSFNARLPHRHAVVLVRDLVPLDLAFTPDFPASRFLEKTFGVESYAVSSSGMPQPFSLLATMQRTDRDGNVVFSVYDQSADAQRGPFTATPDEFRRAWLPTA